MICAFEYEICDLVLVEFFHKSETRNFVYSAAGLADRNTIHIDGNDNLHKQEL